VVTTIYWSNPTATLHAGDARDVLAAMPDGSADCIVTSPPYWAKRDYGVAGQYGCEPDAAGYVDTLRTLFSEARRVLADGTCWLNLGDSYSAGSATPSGKHAYIGPGLMGRHTPGMEAKNLLGLPWRVALALQDDGWILRNAIDPAIVAGWMGEVQAQRIVAEARLRQGSGRQRMTAEEITRVVSSLRDLMSELAAADPADKAQIYSQLGLALTYDPGSQTIRAEARPLPMYVRKCPRGDLNPHAPFEALAPQASASAYSATRTYAGPRYRPGRPPHDSKSCRVRRSSRLPPGQPRGDDPRRCATPGQPRPADDEGRHPATPVAPSATMG
jgi:hypothetical protein